MAAIKNYDQLGRNLIPHSSAGQKSKIGFTETKLKRQQVSAFPLEAPRENPGFASSSY